MMVKDPRLQLQVLCIGVQRRLDASGLLADAHLHRVELQRASAEIPLLRALQVQRRVLEEGHLDERLDRQLSLLHVDFAIGGVDDAVVEAEDILGEQPEGEPVADDVRRTSGLLQIHAVVVGVEAIGARQDGQLAEVEEHGVHGGSRGEQEVEAARRLQID